LPAVCRSFKAAGTGRGPLYAWTMRLGKAEQLALMLSTSEAS
tara:strand:- start:9497 stop:9622 length:126 start_codon:yes stop_codon:yes gene_type:complete